MQAAILAGGRGQRLGSQADQSPKALFSLTGKPMLQHVLELFAARGVTDFVVAIGPGGAAIKRWLFDLLWLDGDVVVDFGERAVRGTGSALNGCKVTLVETGTETAKGDRLARLAPYLGPSPFVMAYCDGLCDLDLDALASFHTGSGRAVSVVAVNKRDAYGVLRLDGDNVQDIQEKPIDRERWINAGIFMVDRAVLTQIDTPGDDWETGLLPRLASKGALGVYRHHGRWACLDTPKDIPDAEAFVAAISEAAT